MPTDARTREYNSVILAALLHDIGKFTQRIDSKTYFKPGGHTARSLEFIGDLQFRKIFENKDWVDFDLVATLISHHHYRFIKDAVETNHLQKRELALAKLVCDADSFSAGERHIECRNVKCKFTSGRLTQFSLS
ncbi:HD domain-containing protein [candidate division KSB1 bacterium]|nr:HD domain-containing protein [candidate division KSB1 bacterium]NIR73276.1 HD domain-containing protein [candidate division KSB1 bacterium]NIS26982.1 HD domain-containing protein [candidate division KSB1 bacterium]NIT73822.1 HD domain-containing protein [candidate division KSB1 bacterium]NIU27727.1 HD domain-containing protein [candidate division KSB1 bacterium]